MTDMGPYHSGHSRAGVTFLILLAAVTAAITIGGAGNCRAGDYDLSKVRSLYRSGLVLIDKKSYLEALDCLSEARQILEKSKSENSREFSDILYAMAEAKMKGRIHQGFSAAYVKSALKDVLAANKVRETMTDIPAQTLAEGYYLAGIIQTKFIPSRREDGYRCLEKCVTVNPGSAACKRELSGLLKLRKEKKVR
jgi:hypothetical protein